MYYPDRPWESNPDRLLGEDEPTETPVSAAPKSPCLHVFEEDADGELVCLLCGRLDREWSDPDSAWPGFMTGCACCTLEP